MSTLQTAGHAAQPLPGPMHPRTATRVIALAAALLLGAGVGSAVTRALTAPVTRTVTVTVPAATSSVPGPHATCIPHDTCRAK